MIKLLVLVSTCLFLLACATLPQVCIEEQCWQVKIAQTPDEREQGLMNAHYLPPDQGMLFIFDEPGPYTFWMKDTYLALDIIWILDDEVVHIERNVPTCTTQEQCPTYRPRSSANYVLEVNAGQTHDIRVGDKVTLP